MNFMKKLEAQSPIRQYGSDFQNAALTALDGVRTPPADFALGEGVRPLA